MKQYNNKTISVIFFGTHDFAMEILQGLLDNSEVSVKLVITQPDKPVGRKQEMQKSAVKILAEKNNLKIEQPESLKNFQFPISNFQLCVVVQYGLIIPQRLLDIPKLGFINIHTSSLPKYRGASPVQTALMNGETETGITIMKMDAGMDTGAILLQKPVKIDPDDTYPILSQKLVKTAILVLPEAILGYISGSLVPQPQDNSQATYTKILTRDDGKINWSKTAQEIYNQYRGLTPWPGVWTTMNGKRVKLLKIKLADKNLEFGNLVPQRAGSRCGGRNLETGKFFIGCGEGAIEVLELQLEGGKAMNAKTFLHGINSFRAEREIFLT